MLSRGVRSIRSKSHFVNEPVWWLNGNTIAQCHASCIGSSRLGVPRRVFRRGHGDIGMLTMSSCR